MSIPNDPIQPAPRPQWAETTLAYAAPAAWHRRHARLIAATAFGLIVAVLSMLQQERIGRWRIAWAQHRRVLELQHKCDTWALPQDAIVFESDPARALESNGRDPFRAISTYGPGMRDETAGPRFVTGAARQDLNWIAFQQTLLPAPRGGRIPGATVFVQRLRSPVERHDRIVVVEYFGEGPAFLTTVIEPGSWTGRSPRSLRSGDGDTPQDRNERTRRVLWIGEPGVRLFAGQPDSGDRSKFTIAYEIGPVRGTLHGRLNDDETVAFQPDTGMIVADSLGNGWYPTSQPAGERR